MMIGLRRQTRRAFGSKSVIEAVIDLVRYHGDTGILRALNQFAQ